MKTRLLTALVLAAALSSGCNLLYKQNIQQGNAMDQEDLDELKLGMTRNQVSFLLGTPSIQDPFHADRWDYMQTFSRRGGDINKRKVTLYFENDRLVRMDGVDDPYAVDLSEIDSSSEKAGSVEYIDEEGNIQRVDIADDADSDDADTSGDADGDTGDAPDGGDEGGTGGDDR